MNKDKQNKEDFCPACLVAIPMAFTGMGAAGYSNSALSSSSKKQKKSRTTLMIIGVLGILLMLLSYPLWIRMKRGCASCSV